MGQPIVGIHSEEQRSFDRVYGHPISVEEKRTVGRAAVIGAILFALAAVAAAFFVR